MWSVIQAKLVLIFQKHKIVFSKFLRELEQKSPFLCVFRGVAAMPQQEGICVISGAYL